MSEGGATEPSFVFGEPALQEVLAGNQQQIPMTASSLMS